jgi:hypothetical protein
MTVKNRLSYFFCRFRIETQERGLSIENQGFPRIDPIDTLQSVNDTRVY